MKVVLQRVRSGRVIVDDQTIAQIGRGVVILLGIGLGDIDKKMADERLRYLVEKIATLRIFEDEHNKINRSLIDVEGAAIVVSQFTLYADTRKGRRPSFTDAAPPEIARPLVNQFAVALADAGVPTQKGEFGAHMLVEIENDGPVTILLER
jgi:D-aminoacyl-tRNA deacylase